jgi:pyruvate dehydrogenase E2 component (dihydrolipoamide acetyltransferase)
MMRRSCNQALRLAAKQQQQSINVTRRIATVAIAASRSLTTLSSASRHNAQRCACRNCRCTCCSNRINLISILKRNFASKSYPDHILLTMPALSPTMEKGNLSSWKKQIGDEIKVGEVMAEVETDKATVAFEAVEEGYLAKILVGDNSNDVTVGVPVAVLAENKEDVAAFKDFSVDGDSSSAAAPLGDTGDKAGDSTVKKTKASNTDSQHQQAQHQEAEHTQPQQQQSQQQQSSSSGGRVIASPNARRVAGEQGVQLSNIQGTGPDGRILTADVMEQKSTAKSSKPATSQQQAQQTSHKPIAAQADGQYTDIPHSNMRKVIAQRLTQSKQQIPHYYLTMESCMDQLMSVRASLNARAVKKDGDKAVKLSVNDFIIKAAALACKTVPQVNSSWQDGFVRQYGYCDVSVAVSTDAGLVTPIVKDADVQGLTTIAKEIKQLAAKARANKLAPHEYQGGTFTISNLGMYGITNFSAIINPPQAAILAVGGSTAKVVQVKGKDGAPDTFKTSQFLSVTLSCDHRVVDGAVGAQWLQAFKGYVENPITMLL